MFAGSSGTSAGSIVATYLANGIHGNIAYLQTLAQVKEIWDLMETQKVAKFAPGTDIRIWPGSAFGVLVAFWVRNLYYCCCV